MGSFVLENVHSVALVLLYLGRGESNTQAITFSWFQLLQGLYSPENIINILLWTLFHN